MSHFVLVHVCPNSINNFGSANILIGKHGQKVFPIHFELDLVQKSRNVPHQQYQLCVSLWCVLKYSAKLFKNTVISHLC